MSPIKINKRLIPVFIIVGVSILAGLGVVFSDSFQKAPQSEVLLDHVPKESEVNTKSLPLISEDESTTLAVYITGAVKRPKVYYMQSGDRISDVLDIAGVGKSAHLASVNLAAEICDAMHIYIPTKNEVRESNFNPLELVSSYKSLEQKEREEDSAQNGTIITNKASGETQSIQESVVNVNRANAVELEALPGVGPATAEKIISERELNGPYLSADDLLRVSGIGEKKLEQMRPFVSL